MSHSANKLFSTGKLACPRCGGALSNDADLSCHCCNLNFPLLDGIPILVEKPEEYVGSWFQQFRNFIMRQQTSIQHEKNMIGSPTCYAPQRERLKNIINARMHNLQTIADLMTPLRDLGPGKSPQENITSAGQFSSPVYLFRDWGWDTGEPDIMCDKVKEILPSDLSMESLLVLGSGGCGESYILHEHYNCPLTISLEIDPFKLLGASRIVSGGELGLYQIHQNNIRNAHDNVSFWTLRAPGKPDNEFLYLLADGTRLPFAENSFHVLFTPFIIDAIGEDLRTLAPKLNRVIQPGGLWINYGVMSFKPEVAYTGEEVLSIVEDSGFRVITHGYERKPHVAPRESCLQQVFDCLYFTAEKVS